MNELFDQIKLSSILVTMSFVEICIFFKGLLDWKGSILNTINKYFEMLSHLFHILLHLVKKKRINILVITILEYEI